MWSEGVQRKFEDKRLCDIDKFGGRCRVKVASLVDSPSTITFNLTYQLTERDECLARLTSSTNRPTTLSAP
jgi:hypothetical protein